MIVAFYSSTGPKSGKDTTAEFVQEYLAAEGIAVYKTAFAREMKLVCADALGIRGTPEERIAIIDEIKLNGGVEVDVGGTVVGTVTGRDFIIGLAGDETGETGVRRLAPHFWIEHTLPEGWEAGYELAFLTDLRFQNEADWVTANGGVIVDVINPRRTRNGFRSEAGINAPIWHKVYNDRELLDLRLRAVALARRLAAMR